MRKERKWAAAAATLVLVVIVTPVHAKGIDYAHFSGPALPADGVTLIRAGGIRQTGLVAPKKNSLAALGVTREDLGTAYRARYRMDYAPRHSLRQVVYPYAEGGPVTFTPRDQHIGQDYESFRGGWHAAGPGLLRLLVSHGFPSHDPSVPNEVAFDPEESQAPDLADATTQTSVSGARWGPAIGGVLLTILVAFAATRLRRSSD